MKESFENAIRFVLFWEKFYSDDSQDPGGLSIWGISYKSHPEYVRAMREMDERDARIYAIDVYRKLYWDAAGCDQIIAPLDIVIFDCAVDQGINAAKAIAGDTENWEDALFLRIDRYAATKKAHWTKRIVSLRDYILSDFKNLHW